MTATLPPYQQLIESAKAIHQDNLDLLHRIAAGETDPGTYLDCTLNGAQYHIFDFFEALASFNYGEVPWRDTKFMLDSTNALVKAVEKKFPLPSAHAVGQALRSSQLWWCLDKPKAALSQKAYVKHLVSARESIYDALNAFNRDLYTGTPALERTPTATSVSRTATKADLRSAVKTILRGEDVNAPKPGPRPSSVKQRQIEDALHYLKTHRGCTLHNACLRSFTKIDGGYKSAKSMFAAINRKGNN